MLPSLQVEMLPTAVLAPYAANARQHPEAQVRQLAASIREFGFNVPVLVDDAGVLIAGHGRVLAAKALGLASTRTEFPAILELGERVLTRRQQAAVGAAVADRHRPVVQNITIQTPDAGSFRQSRGQVLAELSRSVARSNRHR